jgi:hypothetical protein
MKTVKIQTFKKAEISQVRLVSQSYRSYLMESASFNGKKFEEVAGIYALKKVIREQVRIHNRYESLAGDIFKFSKLFLTNNEARKKFYEKITEKVEAKKAVLNKKDKTPEEKLAAREVLVKIIGQAFQAAFIGVVGLVPKIPGTGPIVLFFVDRAVKHVSGGKLGLVPEGLYHIIETVVREDEAKEKENGEEEN